MSKSKITNTIKEFTKINYPHKGAIWCAEQLNCSSSIIKSFVLRNKIKLTPEGKNFCFKKRWKDYPHNRENCKVSLQPFLNIIDPHICYLLGFLWADGWIDSKYEIRMALKELDMKMLAPTFKKCGNWQIKYGIKNGKFKQGLMRTSNKFLVEFLRDHDYDKKSKCCPSKILNKIPNNLKHYFWRGYFDGDGSWSTNYKFNIWSSYEQNWNEVIKLFKELDLSVPSITYYNRKAKNDKFHRSSTIGIYNAPSIIKLGTYIYPNECFDNIGLKRKFNSFKNIKNKFKFSWKY